jgi:hypothetical protein
MDVDALSVIGALSVGLESCNAYIPGLDAVYLGPLDLA